MPKQNSLPTRAHVDLDKLITLIADGVDKIKLVRSSQDLPKTERQLLEDAFDDIRLAQRFARHMREQQEDIVEGTSDEQATTTGG